MQGKSCFKPILKKAFGDTQEYCKVKIILNPKAETENDVVKHLNFIVDRLVNVYGEKENYDFMVRFRKIITTEAEHQSCILGYSQQYGG
ncbi:MAG: hypothetical protein IIB81_01385 [Nanoarchaeota archaeon]|nr:hypothetical protein [Nanoarchaeota archaeon]